MRCRYPVRYLPYLQRVGVIKNYLFCQLCDQWPGGGEAGSVGRHAPAPRRKRELVRVRLGRLAALARREAGHQGGAPLHRQAARGLECGGLQRAHQQSAPHQGTGPGLALAYHTLPTYERFERIFCRIWIWLPCCESGHVSTVLGT